MKLLIFIAGSAALLAGVACRAQPPVHTGFEATLRERRDSAEPFTPPAVEVPVVEIEPSSGERYLSNRAAVQRPRIGDDVLHQLDLRGAPLSEALHLLAATAGVNIYLDARLDSPVDASFPAVRIDDALGVLLDRNNLSLVEEPAGIYWVRREDGSELVTERFDLASVKASDVLENLLVLVGERAQLVADLAQNFVLVHGPEREVEQVARYLASADRLKRQVLIEVEILEVTLDDRFELGVQALLTNSNFLGEAAIDVVQDFSTSDLSFTGVLNLHDSPIDVTINAMESYGVVNVLSSPRVVAIDNSESMIEVITEIPYIQATTAISSDAGASTTSTEQIEFKEAGIKLTVTPGIQAGGIVHLKIDQEFSEVVDTFAGIPVIDKRRVTSQFLVESDDTAVIGGLIQNRVTETDRGVPLLMHLPLIGRLFRSDNDQYTRRELVVMITPRILDPSRAAAYARQYRQSYTERLERAGVKDVLEER